MKSFKGEALRWEWRDGILELTLDRAPANEIGTVMLGELERFAAAAPTPGHTLIGSQPLNDLISTKPVELEK